MNGKKNFKFGKKVSTLTEEKIESNSLLLPPNNLRIVFPIFQLINDLLSYLVNLLNQV